MKWGLMLLAGLLAAPSLASAADQAPEPAQAAKRAMMLAQVWQEIAQEEYQRDLKERALAEYWARWIGALPHSGNGIRTTK